MTRLLDERIYVDVPFLFSKDFLFIPTITQTNNFSFLQDNKP